MLDGLLDIIEHSEDIHGLYVGVGGQTPKLNAEIIPNLSPSSLFASPIDLRAAKPEFYINKPFGKLFMCGDSAVVYKITKDTQIVEDHDDHSEDYGLNDFESFINSIKLLSCFEDIKYCINPESCEEEIDQLLKNGANPNIPNKDGYNALYYACYYDQFEMVKKLLSYNADPMHIFGAAKDATIISFACHIVKKHPIFELMFDALDKEAKKEFSNQELSYMLYNNNYSEETLLKIINSATNINELPDNELGCILNKKISIIEALIDNGLDISRLISHAETRNIPEDTKNFLLEKNKILQEKAVKEENEKDAIDSIDLDDASIIAEFYNEVPLSGSGLE